MANISPFKGFENAVIYFELLSPSGLADKYGNPEFNTVEVPVKAALKESSKGIFAGRRDEVIAGLDRAKVHVRGRLVEPMNYPDGLVFPQVCRAIIQGTEGQLHLIAPTRFAISESLSQDEGGARVRGWFQSLQQLVLKR